MGKGTGKEIDGRGRGGRRLKVKGIDKNEANKFGFRANLGGVQISREALATLKCRAL
jgi:hypothetical protein